jgi:hypothetical protein
MIGWMILFTFLSAVALMTAYSTASLVFAVLLFASLLTRALRGQV